eukprot:tig00000836_g4708.t1
MAPKRDASKQSEEPAAGTTDTFALFVDKVLVPWRDQVRERAENPNLKPVVMLDNHVSHRKNSAYMEQKGFTLLWLPPRCSSVLQPLDQAFNKTIKQEMRAKLAAHLVGLRSTVSGEESVEHEIITLKTNCNKIWEDIDENRGPMVQGCWRKTGFYNAVWADATAAPAEEPEPAADPDAAAVDEDDISDAGLSDVLAEDDERASSEDESESDDGEREDEAESDEDGFGNEDV